MIYKYTKDLSSSESGVYSIQTVDREHGTQASYNLPKEFIEKLETLRILEPFSFENITARTGVDTHDYFKLNDEWTFKLDDSIYNLIDQKFSERTCKALFCLGDNGKMQFIKTSFKKAGYEYEWFLDLYEKGGTSGAELICMIDDEEKSIQIGLDFSKLISKKIRGQSSDDNLGENQVNCFIENPEQKIFYGVPGCGKSYEVKQLILTLLRDGNFGTEKDNVIRTVFHPDYCNADFIGQIIPRVKAGENNDNTEIEYRFVPGPLSKILWKAYHNPSQKFFLVIEEINRGNAAAIFGDLFQLLDRNEEGDCKYFSEYPINNLDISNYIFNCDYDGNEIDERLVCPYPDYVDGKFKLVNDYVFSQNTGIYLPPNLAIYATMNTSDANVFTLDNAFQRRMKQKYITNEVILNASSNESISTEQINNMNETRIEHANKKIGETSISWGHFRQAINNYLISNSRKITNVEDKQLGLFFMPYTSNEIIDFDEFVNKVMKYLWVDVFKHDRKLFKVNSFQEILNNLNENDGDSFKTIFEDVSGNFYSELFSNITFMKKTNE